MDIELVPTAPYPIVTIESSSSSGESLGTPAAVSQTAKPHWTVSLDTRDWIHLPVNFVRLQREISAGGQRSILHELFNENTEIVLDLRQTPPRSLHKIINE